MWKLKAVCCRLLFFVGHVHVAFPAGCDLSAIQLLMQHGRPVAVSWAPWTFMTFASLLAIGSLLLLSVDMANSISWTSKSTGVSDLVPIFPRGEHSQPKTAAAATTGIRTAVVYTVEPVRWRELGQSLQLLYDNLPSIVNYDVVFVSFSQDVFGLPNRTRSSLLGIRGNYTPAAVHFIHVDVGRHFMNGYKRMIYFWVETILSHPAFSHYHYILRLDSDSLILSPLHVDIADRMRAANAVFAYHCWTFEQSDDDVGFSNILRAAGGRVPAQNGVIPMFYNNFMMIDRAAFATDQRVHDFVESLVSGINVTRWGDALIWAAVIDLFYDETRLLFVPELHYQHGRLNRFITLPGHAESVQWNYSLWRESGGEPTGHCWDRRILSKCIFFHNRSEWRGRDCAAAMPIRMLWRE